MEGGASEQAREQARRVAGEMWGDGAKGEVGVGAWRRLTKERGRPSGRACDAIRRAAAAQRPYHAAAARGASHR